MSDETMQVAMAVREAERLGDTPEGRLRTAILQSAAQAAQGRGLWSLGPEWAERLRRVGVLVPDGHDREAAALAKARWMYEAMRNVSPRG